MKKILLSTILCIATFLSISPVYAQENDLTTFETQPRADIYQWILKTENGKMYKRLWNASK